LSSLLLDPGTNAIDEAPHGRDRVAGTIVLSPGGVRGTRFVRELASTGFTPEAARQKAIDNHVPATMQRQAPRSMTSAHVCRATRAEATSSGER
jgi:hypothetical protein